MPHRAERGYAVRPGGGPLIAFVPHPEVAGWWFRTDVCVLIIACPYCKSPAGEPCRGREGFSALTHSDRRAAGKEHRGRVEEALGIVFDLQLRLVRRKRRELAE